jgi:hypothetical protein
MSIKLESKETVETAVAMKIAGGWLAGWSGILLLLAFI